MKQLKLVIIAFITITSVEMYAQDVKQGKDPNTSFYQLDSLMQDLRSNDLRWNAFIKGTNLLTGIYHLKIGEEDKQQPHDTDEVYYIVEGKAKFVADDRQVAIEKGSILFVKADIAHKFVAIEEDLVILVFFDQ